MISMIMYVLTPLSDGSEGPHYTWSVNRQKDKIFTVKNGRRELTSLGPNLIY
jgi:hypothetical protein